MLSEEGLVPVQPLTEHELGTTWADSWSVVRRYREFFHACKDPIGEALGASPLPNSWSDRGEWFWQDNAWTDGVRIAVGFFCTDEYERIPAAARTRTPLVWMAVKADRLMEWPQLTGLDVGPPDGWSLGQRWNGDRPTIWRPLARLLTVRTFDEQREALASAIAAAHPWIRAAIEGRHA